MTAVANHQHARWSIARRFFSTAMFLIVVQAFASLAISSQLRRFYTSQHIHNVLNRQVIRPLHLIDDQLAAMSGVQAAECCTREDYQRFLSQINLSDGKVAMISGAAGLVAARNTSAFYTPQDLNRFSRLVAASSDGFAIADFGESGAVSIKSVKLSGGDETGSLVYVRPIYSMQLINTFGQLKVVSELILMGSLAILLAIALIYIFRPVRAIRERLAAIQMSNLTTAIISVEGQPSEFLPILSEFNRMVDRLEVASSNQKQFASTISHEFRTPLTVVSGFIQSVLNRSTDLSDVHRDALTVANHEALRLNRMLSDLLDLSRADNHQLTIRQEPFDLISACRQALKLARAAFDNPIADGLGDSSELQAIGDPDRLVQCLENLIGNAVKYSEPGSPIDLEVETKGSEVAISVVDQGQGIPLDQQELIFERFRRAEGVSLRSGQTSSGLGLSIVKMLVVGMGGRIAVRSLPSEGSRFTITLPVAAVV